MKITFTAAVNRSTDSLSVDIRGFSPKELIVAPEGSTHFVLRATAAEVDFVDQKFLSMSAVSPPIAVESLQQEAISSTTSIPGSTKPLFLALGISFVQVLNGISYAMRSRQFAAMQVVKVDTGVAG